MLTEDHRKILEMRGLDVEMLAMLGVESYPELGDNWIKIPYVVGGKVVNHKYRTISGQKEFRQDKDAKKAFWNFDVLLDETLSHEPLVIAEGEFDAVAALQSGFARTLSVPDGAPATVIGERDTAKYSYLDEALPLILKAETIIICADGDEAGNNLLQDISVRIGRARCKFVKYPQGCKDLNDALRNYGENGVRETLKRAQWVSVEGVHRMDELTPVPTPKPHIIGIPGLSDHYKIRVGDLCVITGVPGHGKSTFINDIACHMADRHGWNVCFASFEQHPTIDHRRNLRTWKNKYPAKDQQDEEIQAADKWIDEKFVFIVPSEEDHPNLPWLMERMKVAVTRYDCRLLVIDPWNEIEHDRPRDLSLTEYVNVALREFKRFARVNQCHIIVAAHPAKMRRANDGAFPIPSIYDISDSAAWYNKPDVCIVVHRLNFEESDTLVKVAKSRYYDQIGRPGEIEMSFNPGGNRYV